MLDFVCGLATARRGEEGEAMEVNKMPYPRSLKETTVLVFYFQD